MTLKKPKTQLSRGLVKANITSLKEVALVEQQDEQNKNPKLNPLSRIIIYNFILFLFRASTHGNRNGTLVQKKTKTDPEQQLNYN